MIFNFKAYTQRSVFYALIASSPAAFYKTLSTIFNRTSLFGVNETPDVYKFVLP